MCLSIAVIVSLLSAVASAAAAHKKPKIWKGYGFLPGYHQPLNNAAPLFKQDPEVLRNARRERRPWYITRTPVYYRWSDGEKYYFGRPGADGVVVRPDAPRGELTRSPRCDWPRGGGLAMVKPCLA